MSAGVREEDVRWLWCGVMTWNVEDLFLPGDDAAPDTHATFDRKIASLAAVIGAQARDILALQEVGPPTRSITSAAR